MKCGMQVELNNTTRLILQYTRLSFFCRIGYMALEIYKKSNHFQGTSNNFGNSNILDLFFFLFFVILVTRYSFVCRFDVHE